MHPAPTTLGRVAEQAGDLVGRRLGHYRVDGVIGRGGMSTMYRATDVRLGRTVALKIMSDALAGDPEFRERFVDEARNTSAVDHPHVVPLYDFGDLDGMLFLVMRYVEGADLSSLLAAGPLAPHRTLLLLGQVAEALDVLHGRQLVHLDVKPANVLVTRREGSAGREGSTGREGAEHAYLADFGLTRRGTVGHRTRGGDFLGSPTYAAPEHLRGEAVDARTDVYSLACMFFACLTGHPPFRGSVDEVIDGHLSGEVPAVSAAVVLPACVDSVVRRGMTTVPDARPGSCRELMTLAHHALAGTPRPDDPPVLRTGWTPPEPSGPARPVNAHSVNARPAPPIRSAPPTRSLGKVDVAAMRLRDPLPTRTGTAFTVDQPDGGRWVAPAGVLLVVALVVVVLLVVL